MRSLVFCCVRLCTCASACLTSCHWYACEVSGLLLFTCAWIPRVCCSTILPSSIVSGLSPPPTLPCFHCIYHISATAALLPFCMGLMAGLPRFSSPGTTGSQLLDETAGSSWMSGALNLHLAMLLLIDKN